MDITMAQERILVFRHRELCHFRLADYLLINSSNSLQKLNIVNEEEEEDTILLRHVHTDNQVLRRRTFLYLLNCKR